MSTPSKTHSSGEFKKEETLACVLSWNTDWFEKNKGAHSSGGVSENLDKNSGKKHLLCQRDAWCPSDLELHPLAIFSLLQEGEPDHVYSFSLEEKNLDCVLSWKTDRLANPKEGCRSDDSAGEIKSDSCPEPVYKWPKKNSCSDDSSSTDEEDLTSIDIEQSDVRRERKVKRKKRCRDRRGHKKKQKVAMSGKGHSSIGVGSLEDPECNQDERLSPKNPTPMLNEGTEDTEEGPMDTANDEDIHKIRRRLVSTKAPVRETDSDETSIEDDDLDPSSSQAGSIKSEPSSSDGTMIDSYDGGDRGRTENMISHAVDVVNETTEDCSTQPFSPILDDETEDSLNDAKEEFPNSGTIVPKDSPSHLLEDKEHDRREAADLEPKDIFPSDSQLSCQSPDEEINQPQRDDAVSETSSSYKSNDANVKREDESPGHFFLTDSQVTTEAEKNEYCNIPKMAQSDETDSVDSIKHAIEGSSATGTFGVLGGKLSTKSHGFTLHIPPGALEEDEKISLQVLTEIPNGLTLKEDELLVSHGFQCYPSGLRFKKPAKLIIPHCALVTAPNKVQTILYSLNQSGTPIRLPDSSNFICSVQERWLEVSVSHFSGGFITIIWDWLFLKGIVLSCMPFLPRVLPHSRKPVLEVRFVKKPHDQKWNTVHELNDPDYRPVKGDDDDIVYRKEPLEVACQLDEKSWMRRDPILYSEMSSNGKVTRYFPLDLTEESDETLVTLEVVQTSTQTIQFNTRFQEIDKETTAEQNVLSPPTDEIPSDEQEVTDENILKLARLLTPNMWSSLYVALGIDYSTAEGIRKEFKEMTEQYIHLLQNWKAASSRTRKDLNAILIEVEAAGLVEKYVD